MSNTPKLIRLKITFFRLNYTLKGFLLSMRNQTNQHTKRKLKYTLRLCRIEKIMFEYQFIVCA